MKKGKRIVSVTENFLGIIGESAFIDSMGQYLYVGDLVACFYKNKYVSVNLIVKDEKNAFVMGFADNSRNGNFKENLLVYKMVPYKNVTLEMIEAMHGKHFKIQDEIKEVTIDELNKMLKEKGLPKVKIIEAQNV